MGTSSLSTMLEMRVSMLLITCIYAMANASTELSPFACKLSTKTRRVRFWLTNGVGGVQNVNTTSNKCTKELLGNVTKFLPAIDTLAPTLWDIGVANASAASVNVLTDPTSVGMQGCVQELHTKFPDLHFGAVGATSECWNANCGPKVVGRNPEHFAASAEKFMQDNELITEFWTDWEAKLFGPSDTAGVNKAFDLLSKKIPVYRYAGCVHNNQPAYFNETCKQFSEGAPRTIVQAAGTYWDNTPSGFEKLLRDQISDIGAENVAKMSPAVCPDCSHYDSLTQEELYQRMDLMCALGIVDVSAFTFMEIAQLKAGGGEGVGARWMEALAYFRTGKRGLILPTPPTIKFE